jgi:predicted fused transcriptional regulator/phosphomethylpyrimidine kinase/predicted transcriptional regulator
MFMKFPCEIIAEPYISQLRVEAAKNLRQFGYSQLQIAELLQVSQPVVSGYLKKQIDPAEFPVPIIERAKEIGLTTAQLLLENGLEGIPKAIDIACKTCKILRQGGAICAFHKAILPVLEDDCARCQTGVVLVQLQTNRQLILKELQRIFHELSKHSNFDSIIPEIGLQMVLGVAEMTNGSDIAGFPGRIIKRKQGKPSAEIPTFGSSERASNLLLAVNKYDSEIIALAGIKTSTSLLKQLKRKKISHYIVEEFDQDSTNKLHDLIEDHRGIPSVIVDTGSVGFEAISYVFAKSGTHLQSLLLELI